jgi:FMN phosphatase YigB (HAD superfamily)
MTLSLLLDLDDTLLESNLEAFIPAYFRALGEHLSSRLSPQVMLPALLAGMQAMLENQDPGRSLQAVFEAEFYPRTGLSKESLDDLIEQFYDEIFPSLRELTRPRPGAADLVDWAFEQGFRVAIATDPLFPRKATLHRLRWAGLDPERFELVSSFESFHFSKSHPAYFAEMLGRLGWPDGPILMAGNDVERDLLPAQRLGLATFHVDGAGPSGPDPKPTGRGDLGQLKQWLNSNARPFLVPAFDTPEAIRALMASTPAVMAGLTAHLPAAAWAREPSPEDWAVIEVLCHLRDTEREIHDVQIRLMLEETDPFIPRADAAVWAKQRRYLGENGPAALADFTAARVRSLEMLAHAAPDAWARKARHAIFGPTDFREVVGFMAEHDRLHVQQAWKTIKGL